MDGATKEAGGLQTVSRAVLVLRCFEEGRAALTLAELTRRTGLNKATTFRLAETLSAEGLLEKDPESGVYTVSFGLISLGRALLDPEGLASLAQPVLSAAARSTGETAILSIRRGGEAIVLAEVPSAEPVRYTLGVGYRADLRVGAAGLAILAHLPEAEAGAITGSPGARTVSGAEIGAEQLLRSITEARENGYATTEGQRLKDAAGYAAPLFGVTGQVVGSIGVIMPAHRNQDAARQTRFAEAATASARQLNSLIGNGRRGAGQ
ncbi:MAG: IclR family transcriptional regulator [Rhodobacteraceae bacterium]|nr:IclR family transcriptional regulator [Paracoccaceae bacterium]